jgi:hypothetical protein
MLAMSMRVFAVGLLPQFAITLICVVDVRNLALLTKMPTLAAIGAPVLGAFAGHVMVFRGREVSYDQCSGRGRERRKWHHSFLDSYHHHLLLMMASPASATHKLSPCHRRCSESLDYSDRCV